MEISKFFVIFSVMECGNGLELLSGYYNQTSTPGSTTFPVSVKQVRNEYD